jgi:hypothetical protein
MSVERTQGESVLCLGNLTHSLRTVRGQTKRSAGFVTLAGKL